MSQQIYTRQVRIPRRNRPLTAKDIQRYVKQELAPGEELLQVALTSVEATCYVIEVGVQKRA
jgi:hypothetical protein